MNTKLQICHRTLVFDSKPHRFIHVHLWVLVGDRYRVSQYDTIKRLNKFDYIQQKIFIYILN